MSIDYVGAVVSASLGLALGSLATLLVMAVVFDCGPIAKLRKRIADWAIRKSARECARNRNGANHAPSKSLHFVRSWQYTRERKQRAKQLEG